MSQTINAAEFTESTTALDLRFATEHERLTARRSGIGSSDLGPIMGTNTRYRTPRTLWEDKTGRVEVDTATSEAAEWGQTLERTIGLAFAQRFETQLIDAPYILASKQNPVWMASPDFAVMLNGRLELVECKSRRNPWPDGVPQDIVDQCQWQLAVTGVEKCHVAVLFGGQELKTYGLVRDEPRIAVLREAVSQFWSHVLFDEPPAPLVQDVPRMVPTKGQLVVGADVVDMVRRREDIAAALSTVTAEKNEIDDALKLMLADHEEAVTADGHVIAAYKASEKVTVDAKRLAEEHPRIAKKMTETTTTRRLSVKKAA